MISPDAVAKRRDATLRQARMIYAAATALAEHGGSMPLDDVAKAAGMTKSSPAFRRMLLEDGRFMLKKQLHMPGIDRNGSRHVSFAVYVHLAAQGAV